MSDEDDIQPLDQGIKFEVETDSITGRCVSLLLVADSHEHERFLSAVARVLMSDDTQALTLSVFSCSNDTWRLDSLGEYSPLEILADHEEEDEDGD